MSDSVFDPSARVPSMATCVHVAMRRKGASVKFHVAPHSFDENRNSFALDNRRRAGWRSTACEQNVVSVHVTYTNAYVDTRRTHMRWEPFGIDAINGMVHAWGSLRLRGRRENVSELNPRCHFCVACEGYLYPRVEFKRDFAQLETIYRWECGDEKATRSTDRKFSKTRFYQCRLTLISVQLTLYLFLIVRTGKRWRAS